MSLETLQWIFLCCAPFLAAVVALGLFNGYNGSRNRDQSRERDHWRNLDYLSWCEWVKAQGGVRPVSHVHFLGAHGPCFVIEHEASLYEPLTLPPMIGTVGEPFFDTPSGMPVGEGWSVKDGFGALRHVGRGSLSVTEREIHFHSAAGDIQIPIDEIHTVVASCSELLVGAGSSEVPFLFGGVNGQKLRDVLSFFLEG